MKKVETRAFANLFFDRRNKQRVNVDSDMNRNGQNERKGNERMKRKVLVLVGFFYQSRGDGNHRSDQAFVLLLDDYKMLQLK
jgi:hypothetical protein